MALQGGRGTCVAPDLCLHYFGNSSHIEIDITQFNCLLAVGRLQSAEKNRNWISSARIDDHVRWKNDLYFGRRGSFLVYAQVRLANE